MRTFEEDVKRAVDYHGHLCSGQCIGVKMGRYGMNLLGLDPEADRKKIAVFVECDRCPADSIGIVTGCRVGKRTYKWFDYGKVAATFVNIETGQAIRIHRKKRMHPKDGEDMIAFYRDLPEDLIFSVQPIIVNLQPGDLPGPPSEIVDCAICGEDVTDGKHTIIDGKPVCKACAGQGYYVKQ